MRVLRPSAGEKQISCTKCDITIIYTEKDFRDIFYEDTFSGRQGITYGISCPECSAVYTPVELNIIDKLANKFTIWNKLKRFFTGVSPIRRQDD